MECSPRFAIAFPNKVADDCQFQFTSNGVRFGEFVPFNVQSGGFEHVDLFTGVGKGDHRIEQIVSNEESLFEGDRRKLLEQFLGLTHLSADANNSGEAMRITQTDINRHETSLRKAAENGVVRLKSGIALRVKQFEK